MSTTKRHPSKVRLKSYVDKAYKIIGMDANVRLDGGAYSGLSNIVLQRALFAVCGVYDVANVKAKGTALKTNKVVCGAYRGFGAPQSLFAVELFMEYMANKLNIDPLKFRRMNYVKKRQKTPLQEEHLKKIYYWIKLRTKYRKCLITRESTRITCQKIN